MRLGIRAQLVLSIGVLLALAFAPLLFAAANLTRATVVRAWRDGARSLGRAVAGHVSEARRTRTPAELAPLLEAQLGPQIDAVAVYDAAGARTQMAGRGEGVLPASVEPGRDEVREVVTDDGAGLVVLVPGEGGSVATLLVMDAATERVGPLLRLLALYTALVALALMAFLFVVLTRIVVGPIEHLRRAAGRVAEGARDLAPPDRGGRELLELGDRLHGMTAALRAEEQALRNKVEELRRAQQSIVRSERLASVGRLAAGLAHEIGNPITAILSMTDLVLDGPLDEEQRELVRRIGKETERIHRVLRDLLTFARPAAEGPSEPGAGRASVREAAESVVSLVRPQRAAEGVELSVEVAPELPPVTMNPDPLEQVLLNLLLNAVDAVQKPGGRIWLTAERSEDGVRIAIEDDGGGVDPAVRERLFEPFVTTKDVGKGTGLGLAVCRGLVEAAGGSIELEDGAEGARFVIDLPAQ